MLYKLEVRLALVAQIKNGGCTIDKRSVSYTASEPDYFFINIMMNG